MYSSTSCCCPHGRCRKTIKLKKKKMIMVHEIHDLPAGSAVIAAADVELGTECVSVGFKGLPRLLCSQLVLKASMPASASSFVANRGPATFSPFLLGRFEKLRNSRYVPPGSAEQTGAEVFCHGPVASGGWLGGMLSLS